MKLSPKKRSRLAAAFAISNMGQKVPDDIAETKFGWADTPGDAVCDLAGHLMETDEHEKIFRGEARMWSGIITKKSKAEMLRIWGPHNPWLQKILDVPHEQIR